MNIKHVLKNGLKPDSVKGHRLNKEKTEQVLKIMKGVNHEQKSN